jgi:hypothetical protein
VHLVDHDVPERPEPPLGRRVVEPDLERLGGDQEDVRLVVGVAAPLRGRDVAVERGGREPARQVSSWSGRSALQPSRCSRVIWRVPWRSS